MSPRLKLWVCIAGAYLVQNFVLPFISAILQNATADVVGEDYSYSLMLIAIVYIIPTTIIMASATAIYFRWSQLVATRGRVVTLALWFLFGYMVIGTLWWVYMLYMSPNDVLFTLELEIENILVGFANVDGYPGKFLFTWLLRLAPFILGPAVAYLLMSKKQIRIMPTITVTTA